MDNPVEEIAGVIHKLTQTPPHEQRATIAKYFTVDASFTHPFCRTGSFDGSRFLIRAIYRWYKIMSPEIKLDVKSIAYDEKNLILYVTIFQVFSIWAIPFHRSPVNLTTVLKLQYDKYLKKYYIKSQDDLYQVDQFVRFVWLGGPIVVYLWQFWATFFCLLGAIFFWPISWLEDHQDEIKSDAKELENEARTRGEALLHDAKGEGLITAPAIQQR